MLPVFDAAFDVGATYLDMAMSLSRLHPDRPYENAGVKLGDEQFARAEAWAEAGRLALVVSASSPACPTCSPVTRRTRSSPTSIGVRDGADLVVEGSSSPSGSIWTTIEECLNPPVVWRRAAGGLRPSRSASPRSSCSRRASGAVECVNVEHEEACSSRGIDCERVTFKYGLGDEFIDVLKTPVPGLDRD